ncbi:hypothetical protein NQZ68_013215 [Dissostichus eleginoides]|nr:hypothetical protein NQZ68_013215 [Dissostichus eleginoides]
MNLGLLGFRVPQAAACYVCLVYCSVTMVTDDSRTSPDAHMHKTWQLDLKAYSPLAGLGKKERDTERQRETHTKTALIEWMAKLLAHCWFAESWIVVAFYHSGALGRTRKLAYTATRTAQSHLGMVTEEAKERPEERRSGEASYTAASSGSSSIPYRRISCCLTFNSYFPSPKKSTHPR